MAKARSTKAKKGGNEPGISFKIPALGVCLMTVASAVTPWSLQSLPISGPATLLTLLALGGAMWAGGLFLTVRGFRGVSLAATKIGGRASAGLARTLQVLDEPPLGCFVTDATGVIQHANAPLHVLLGRAQGTLAGYAAADLGLGLGDELQSDADDDERPMRTTYAHPDGSQREFELWSRPLLDGGGAVSGHVTWVEDVTSKNRLARELEDARVRLGRNERLENLGTLAGGLAHDLNNLLAPIMGHLDLAQMDLPADSTAQQDLGLARMAARRAADLATRLLRLSRAERDQERPVRVEEVVHEVLALLSPPDGVSIEILERVDAGCPPVLATTAQLHQVLFNLCKNAVQAMPASGTLTVSVDHVDALATWESRPRGDGPFVRIRVADTGTGMAPETLERIYDPLFTTKAQDEGSGLGLAMVKGIVTGFGGTISVASKAGSGTTFTLLFPPARERSSTPPSGAAESQPGSGRILVVDDDEAVLSVLSRTLSRLGYEVTAFISSEEALKCFLDRSDSFDLLLTDQMMPALTGLELLVKVRDVRPDLPAVLTTGRADAVSQEELQRLRCALLRKPASATELSEVISRGLNRVEPALATTGAS